MCASIVATVLPVPRMRRMRTTPALAVVAHWAARSSLAMVAEEPSVEEASVAVSVEAASVEVHSVAVVPGEGFESEE